MANGLDWNLLGWTGLLTRVPLTRRDKLDLDHRHHPHDYGHWAGCVDHRGCLTRQSTNGEQYYLNAVFVITTTPAETCKSFGSGIINGF